MNRPKLVYNLPCSIVESISDSCELRLDPIDFSHNDKIVQERYESMDDEELKTRMTEELVRLKRQIDQINQLLSGEGEA